MKNVLYILGMIAIVCLASCENDPEKERVTFNKTIIEYYYPEAKYVSTIMDTLDLVSFDTSFVSLQYGGLLNINTGSTNMSFKHLGGWIDTTPPEPFSVASEIWYDPELYDVDTIFHTVTVPISYLIYEIDYKNGMMPKVDTAVIWKDINLKRNHDLEECMMPNPTNESTYLPNLHGYYEIAHSTVDEIVNGQTQDYYMYWLNLLEPIPLSVSDTDIRVFDIFPYWQNPIISAEVIFYINK